MSSKAPNVVFTREFSHGSCNPPCNVTCCCSHQLAPEKYERSGGGWSRTSSQPRGSISHVRVRIGEIRRIIGLGRKGQFLPFIAARRGKSGRDGQPGRISSFQVGISAGASNVTRVSPGRSVHSRSRIFAPAVHEAPPPPPSVSRHRTISSFTQFSRSLWRRVEPEHLPFPSRRAKSSP